VVGHIRWRLVGWSVLVLGAILLVLGAILYASLSRSLMDAVDSSLETSSRTAQVEIAEKGENDLSRAGYQGGLFFLLVDASGTVIVTDRPTTRKTRIVAHNQQVVRADRESTQAVDAKVAVFRTLVVAALTCVRAILVCSIARFVYADRLMLRASFSPRFARSS